MKEDRIITTIGVYGCLILANTSDGNVFPWFHLGVAFFWIIRYFIIKK